MLCRSWNVGVNTVVTGPSLADGRRNVGAPATSSDNVTAHSSDDQQSDAAVNSTDGNMETAAEAALRSIRSKHCLIHNDMHAHPGCEACVRAKTTRGWHKRKEEPRYLRNWGDLATGDHVEVLTNSGMPPSGDAPLC